MAKGVARFFLLHWLLFAFCVPLHTAAQTSTCDPRLVPLNDHLGYRPRGNRCEGLYQARTSAFLELVSLVEGGSNLGKVASDKIKLSVSPSTALPPGQIYLRALCLPLRVYYQMDATIERNSPFSWSSHDVLIPAEIPLDELGFLAWIQARQEKLFVPVRVWYDTSLDVAGEVSLVIRSPIELEWVKWRAYGLDHKPSTASLKWKAIVEESVRPGEPVTIVLPRGLSGRIAVDIRAKAVNRDRLLPLGIHIAR